MSSEDEDQNSEEKPGSSCNAGEYPKKSAFSYTRDILLSIAQLDRCKKLPAGFNISILRDLHDHAACSLEACQSSGTHSFQNNQFGILSQTPEDGILGSGFFTRVPVCRTIVPSTLKDNAFHLLKRSAEPYRPPSLTQFSRSPLKMDHLKNLVIKQRRWIGNDDQYNDETFGLPKDLSEEITETEKQRRDSFLLMRKKQQMKIQGNQDICYKELLKRDLSLNSETCLKPENEEMLVEKYGRSEESEMLVAATNLSEVCKVMQAKASEFLPPECIPDDSSRFISSNFTWAFIDEEKHLTHDQEGMHDSKQSLSEVDQLNCPKQASDSDNDSLEALLSEIQLCRVNKCLPVRSSSSSSATHSTEDLRSPSSENNYASLDFVPIPQNLQGVDVEELVSLSVNDDDDDPKPDDSSRGRPKNVLDTPTSQFMMDFKTESETKLEQCDYGDISFPEEDELICFDDYCVCLPEEEDLISFDNYQLVPQEGEYSSPAATKDNSNSSDNSAEQLVLGNKRYYHSDTESPNNFHNCLDPVSWRTPSSTMKLQDYSSETLPPQPSMAIPCSHQSPRESINSSKAFSRFAKVYGSCSRFPHHLPALLLPDLFQTPEPAATTSIYSVNCLPGHPVPVPRGVPAYQKYSPLRNDGISPCEQKQNTFTYTFQDRQQLPYHDLAFRIPDHAWECW